MLRHLSWLLIAIILFLQTQGNYVLNKSLQLQQIESEIYLRIKMLNTSSQVQMSNYQTLQKSMMLVSYPYYVYSSGSGYWQFWHLRETVRFQAIFNNLKNELQIFSNVISHMDSNEGLFLIDKAGSSLTYPLHLFDLPSQFYSYDFKITNSYNLNSFYSSTPYRFAATRPIRPEQRSYRTQFLAAYSGPKSVVIMLSSFGWKMKQQLFGVLNTLGLCDKFIVIIYKLDNRFYLSKYTKMQTATKLNKDNILWEYEYGNDWTRQYTQKCTNLFAPTDTKVLLMFFKSPQYNSAFHNTNFMNFDYNFRMAACVKSQLYQDYIDGSYEIMRSIFGQKFKLIHIDRNQNITKQSSKYIFQLFLNQVGGNYPAVWTQSHGEIPKIMAGRLMRFEQTTVVGGFIFQLDNLQRLGVKLPGYDLDTCQVIVQQFDQKTMMIVLVIIVGIFMIVWVCQRLYYYIKHRNYQQLYKSRRTSIKQSKQNNKIDLSFQEIANK